MRSAICSLLLVAILVMNGFVHPVQDIRTLQPSPGAQFQPKVWGTRIVWSDYRSSNPTIALFDTTDASLSFLPSPHPSLDHLNPDLSSTLVVWEEGCSSCPHDIWALDLSSRQLLPIATSPADETTPAVSDSTIVWRSFNGSSHALIALDLSSGLTTTIASHPAQADFSFGRPLIDGSTIVWSENFSHSSHLVAFDLSSRSISPLATIPFPSPDYALSYPYLVFTDPALVLFHLPSGRTQTLFQGWLAHAPAIHGNLVVWAGGQDWERSDLDIYGFDLSTNRPFLISNHPARETAPDVFGERVVWQREENGTFQVVFLDLAGKRPPIPPVVAPVENVVPAISSPLAEAEERLPSPAGSPYKGMHGANGDGWQVAMPRSTDAIVGSNGSPYFGYHLVLDSDLGRPTGYPSPRGPTVGDLYRTIRVNFSKVVVVRLWPTLSPNPGGSVTPDAVGQQYIRLASTQDWVRMVQTGNEPNLEWPAACNQCRWVTGGETRVYTWNGIKDYRLYQAINQWYIDVWSVVEWYRGNHPDPTIRSRLLNMTRYTPPMAEIYCNLDNGQNFYSYLQPMIDRYDYFTYHVYPWPEFDALNGYVKNNTWPWFTSWLRTQISNGSILSRITEFGWNPGQMDRTGKTQRSQVWGNDGRWHTFCGDLQGFITYQRKNAYGVMVFLVQATDPVLEKHDALDDNGNPYAWFSCYRSW